MPFTDRGVRACLESWNNPAFGPRSFPSCPAPLIISLNYLEFVGDKPVIFYVELLMKRHKLETAVRGCRRILEESSAVLHNCQSPVARLSTRKCYHLDPIMKNPLKVLIAGLGLLMLSAFNSEFLAAHAQVTAFTYQGRLNNGAGPVTGIYDLEFAICSAASNSAPNIAVTNTAVPVTNGLFTALVDFGAAPGSFATRWLEIGVRTNGGTGSFTTLAPRQQLTATPYAFVALTASNLSGTVSAAQLPASVFTNGATSGIALGAGTVAYDSTSTAIGIGTTAGRDDSTALGNSATATGANSTALGRSASASGDDCTALGGAAQAGGDGSTALGVDAAAHGYHASALGFDTMAQGNSSIALGDSAIATGVGSIALGGTASGLGSTALDGAVASADFSLAAGPASIATNTGAFVWADTHTNNFTTFYSVRDNEFAVRAAGGVRFVTSGAGLALDGTVSASSFTGDGGGLTNLNAGSITSGTLSLNQLPYQVVKNFASVGGSIGLGDDAIANDDGTTALGDTAWATGEASTALGQLSAASSYGSIALGFSAKASGANSTALGSESQASGGASVALGFSAKASGSYSTVAGGSGNSAAGDYSFAAGSQACATNAGAFVWADTQNTNFCSTTTNEFSIRAQNGVRIQADKGIHLNAADEPLIVRDWDAFAANAPASKAGIGRWGLFMEPTRLTIGIPSNDVPNRYFQIAKYSTNGAATQLVLVDQAGNLTAAGTLTGSSDRNAKEHFNAVNSCDVLARVAAMPVSEWNYKSDPATRHIGPMAQDFYAAFSVGMDDRHISMVDADGVALAAIKGLNQKLNEKDAEIQELKARLDKLERLMSSQVGGAQ